MNGKWLWFGVGYGLAGAATVAWTVSLDKAGKPHFGEKGSAAGALAQTFFLWPVAAFVNLKG